ncbi:EpsG family protein [Cronobacter turicensis]|uniref:Wzy n=1 Tax=Cronobacter turicensis (strain DSM 18703 / CCUG 55852 / LMG 23827 / z3032) TaxID=693216 RepID=F8SLH9_CROTZ|nr:EpsG family protein [Cronobacter turicensis]AEH27461.1 Wzy [Cronobacter turicensis z3032]MDI6473054.1 EpsG family protein [Cronobacter turicensis]
MVIYYLFISFVFLVILADIFFVTDAKIRAFFYTILFTIIVVFVGLRYQTGLDWSFYINLYKGSSSSLAIEPGYYLLSYVSSFFIGYWFYQGLITAFLLICLHRYFKEYTKNYLFCIGIFFLYQFIFVSEALRQIIALSIILIAYKKLYQKNIFQFCALSILAILFHVSAIIVFAIIPFSNHRNVNILKMLTVVGVILAVLNIYPIEYIIKLISMLPAGGYIEKIKWYSQDDYAGTVLTFSLTFKLIAVFLFDYRFNYIKSNEPIFINTKKYDLIHASLFLMIFLDVYLGRFGTISTRLDVYFVPCFLVALNYLIYNFKQGISRLIFFCFIMIYFAVNYFSIMNGYYFEKFYSPYQNYIYEFLNPGAYNDREWDVEYYFSNKEFLQ